MPFESCQPSRAEMFPMPPVVRPRRKRQVKRVVNYRSSSQPKTLELQAVVRTVLRKSGTGFTVRELGESLGISRQLALYHLKKMAATAQLVMILEPCSESGGLRYRCWDELQMVVNYRVGVAA